MAHLKITFFLSLVLLGFGNIIKAQQVDIHAVITKADGSEQVYELSESDRISFPNDEILVITQNGTDIQISISEIRKITFDEVLATAENEAKNIGIFPNPANNSFTISGINGFQQMNIYSFDGKLVKREIIDCGQSIDITELPQGLYYVNINKQNFKLIKL
ncbi:MAG: T9SS type A sorting domain-containing protein [Bacteroidales bacterium]|nr:T9SS type A sorting domain-containing protein [Bacteroidales bacterium]